jgi:hypothetical protein
MTFLCMFIFAIILLLFMDSLGIKSAPHKGARSGQLRARWQLRRFRRGKWF